MPIDTLHEFRFRTEDFRLEEIETQFVGTDHERDIIAGLKAANLIILEGSRGTGKSFLMRVAQLQLDNAFSQDRIIPVYLSFLRSSLIHTADANQFQNWMLARLCSAVLKALRVKGLLVPTSQPFMVLAGGTASADGGSPTALERLVQQYEESYRTPGIQVTPSAVPDVQAFKDAIEEICQDLGITRFCILFDEAIHIFRPEQQRQFFTLF